MLETTSRTGEFDAVCHDTSDFESPSVAALDDAALVSRRAIERLRRWPGQRGFSLPILRCVLERTRAIVIRIESDAQNAGFALLRRRGDGLRYRGVLYRASESPQWNRASRDACDFRAIPAAARSRSQGERARDSVPAPRAERIRTLRGDRRARESS